MDFDKFSFAAKNVLFSWLDEGSKVVTTELRQSIFTEKTLYYCCCITVVYSIWWLIYLSHLRYSQPFIPNLVSRLTGVPGTYSLNEENKLFFAWNTVGHNGYTHFFNFILILKLNVYLSKKSCGQFQRIFFFATLFKCIWSIKN